MNDTPQKSTEELAAELEKLMPELESYGSGWRKWANYAPFQTQVLTKFAQLVLAQQQEIKQLKAELEDLKNR